MTRRNNTPDRNDADRAAEQAAAEEAERVAAEKAAAEEAERVAAEKAAAEEAERVAAEKAAAEKAIADAAAIADATTRAATPVVRVSAVRNRWRAGRFWPKGDTDLTAAEADQVGRAGFEALRDDDTVFTIVPLDRAD